MKNLLQRAIYGTIAAAILATPSFAFGQSSSREGTCKVGELDGSGNTYEIECIVTSSSAKLNGQDGYLDVIETKDMRPRLSSIFSSYGNIWWRDATNNWVRVQARCSGREALNYVYDTSEVLVIAYPQLCGE